MQRIPVRSPENSRWEPFVLPWEDAPLDLSFLYEDEKPAGRHGFLERKGAGLVFEDGTGARFWGTCFNSAANFPSHEQSEKVARRLAKFGVNMMRCHQMDGEWSTPNIFQFTRGRRRNDSRSLDPESLDRFDCLVHCLKKQGVYIYMDNLTYRRFKPGDGVAAVDELGPGAKPYACFDPRLVELRCRLTLGITSFSYKEHVHHQYQNPRHTVSHCELVCSHSVRTALEHLERTQLR